MDTNKPAPEEAITTCIYNEICSKKKPCGDCAADQYDREQYEELCEQYKLDQKMELQE